MQDFDSDGAIKGISIVLAIVVTVYVLGNGLFSEENAKAVENTKSIVQDVYENPELLEEEMGFSFDEEMQWE